MRRARVARRWTSAHRSWLLTAALGCSNEAYETAIDAGGAGSSPCGELAAAEPAPVLPGAQPQYRLEPGHRGVAPPATQIDAVPRAIWKTGPLAVGRYNASKSSPAVDADVLYVGEDDGRLYALDRDSGAIRWAFATRRHFEEIGRGDGMSTGIHGSPAFDQSRVYVGDYAGWLYAVDRASGSLVWERKLGGSIGSSPVLFGQGVLIAVEFPAPDGRVFAICAEDGSLMYQSTFLGYHPHGTVSLHPTAGRLLVGTGAGSFFGLDLARGSVLWEARVAGAIKSTAAIGDTMAYVTAFDGMLHAVDVSTGWSRFEVQTGGPSMSSPALHEGLACFGSHDTRVRCVDAATGAVAWEAATGGIVSSSPTIVPASRLVLVGSTDGQLYAFGLDDGTLAWQVTLDAAMTSVAVAVDRSVFVNDDSGTVWRFDG